MHLVHADRRKRVILGSHVLDDRVGLEDIGGNVVSIGTVRRIEGSPVKEANRASFRGFRRKRAEEGAESRVNLFWGKCEPWLGTKGSSHLRRPFLFLHT